MQKQVIEYGGEPVGIVVPDEDRLKFIAVKSHVIDLDKRRIALSMAASQDGTTDDVAAVSKAHSAAKLGTFGDLLAKLKK